RGLGSRRPHARPRRRGRAWPRRAASGHRSRTRPARLPQRATPPSYGRRLRARTQPESPSASPGSGGGRASPAWPAPPPPARAPRGGLTHHQPSPSLPRFEHEHAEHVADPLGDGAGDLVIVERGRPRALLVTDDAALLIRRGDRERALDLFRERDAAVREWTR